MEHEKPQLPTLQIGSDGTEFYLGALPPRIQNGKVLYNAPSVGDAVELIPRSEWRVFNRRLKTVPIYDQNGHGCHDDKTEVLTENGWKKWTDYDGKSLLGTMNPGNGFLEFQQPTHNHIYDYEGELYHSENKCIDFGVTPNHRTYVRKWDERNRTLSSQYSFQNAENLGWYCGLPHATSGFLGVNLERISIPGGREYLGNDFLAMVASIISCGWVGGTENTWRRVSFCCFKENEYDSHAALAYRVGFYEVSGRRGVWETSDIALANWLRQNVFTKPEYRAPFKRVPDIVKTVCQSQISHFLEFFGDKWKSNGVRTFGSSSPRMIDDLQELLLRIGKRGTIGEREPRSSVSEDGREIKGIHPEYSLVERNTERLCLDRKKHLTTDHYKGQVFCATVPNGLLVTRRNGSVLVSGNSCVSYATLAAVLKARAKAGMTFVQLAPTFVYALGNGGRDAGMVISDAADIIRKYGIPTIEKFSPNHIYKNAITQDAIDEAKSRFLVVDVYKCSSFDEIGTAVQLGWDVVYGISVGTGFNNLDSDGVPGGGMPRGGHALSDSEEMKQRSGSKDWLIGTRNSWSPRWGINGFCFLSEGHFDRTGYIDAYAIRSVMTDPKETNTGRPIS